MSSPSKIWALLLRVSIYPCCALLAALWSHSLPVSLLKTQPLGQRSPGKGPRGLYTHCGAACEGVYEWGPLVPVAQGISFAPVILGSLGCPSRGASEETKQISGKPFLLAQALGRRLLETWMG